MVMHDRVCGQAFRGGHEVVERRLTLTAKVEDPAVSILKRGHIRPAQATRDGEGALDALCVVATPGRQKAREVVGDDGGARVDLVEGLVDRDGTVDLAVLFQQRGVHPEQVGVTWKSVETGRE